MNLIAHQFLSFRNQDLSIGNLLGDFVRGRNLDSYPRSIQKGIRLHRLIDSYTDENESVKNCTKLLHADLGKFAPVVVDVLFDYLLHKNWNQFTDLDFEEFKKEQYQWFLAADDFGFDYFNQLTKSIVKGDWMQRYTHPEGLNLTFEFLERTAKFDNQMGKAWIFIEPKLAEFNENFLLFFPEIIKTCKMKIDSDLL